MEEIANGLLGILSFVGVIVAVLIVVVVSAVLSSLYRDHLESSVQSHEEQQRREERQRQVDLKHSWLNERTAETSRSSGLAPPPGGYLHTVSLLVDLSREWHQALCAAGTNTDYHIYAGGSDLYYKDVGGQFPPVDMGVVETQIILMSFGPTGGNWNRALAWGNRNRLKVTDPRHVFAIGEQKPEFHHELMSNELKVSSTKEFISNTTDCRIACQVCWHGDKLGACMERIEEIHDNHDWFAFVRE